MQPSQLQSLNTYLFEIRAVSHSNPGGRDSNGDNCDPFFAGSCDTSFYFCLRRSGTRHDDDEHNCPLGSYSTGDIGGDSFRFGTTRIASGVPNPMTFRGSGWPVTD